MSARTFLSSSTLISVLLGLPCVASEAEITICRGMCDASAVMPVGAEHFVVADDEDNILRVYSRTKGGAPVQTFDLEPFLRVARKSPEVDLEGSARIGDRVYWISSHGRNKDGKLRPNRHRFFATTISSTDGKIEIQPSGKPYADLLNDLLREPRLKEFNLAAAAQLAPKEKNALNIEGLCDTPEGHLLIGFRNPNPNGKALIVPLLNPDELIAGQGQSARFGDPVMLELGGLGIRSMARAGNRYFIIAGSYDGKGRSQLYEWSGGGESPRQLPHPELRSLNPEAIEVISENGRARLFVVSDDGTMKIGGIDCKDVKDANLKYFRATMLDL